MQISEVLATHKENSALGIPDILGDGYLMRSNAVYRNVRAFALKIGCQYKEAWPQYLLLPFHELNNIVASKTIPYVPSGRMLSEIEGKRPGVFNIENLRMPESYHLHESAHVIAEHFFEGVRPADANEKILKMIICESFANTVDALSCVAATADMHRYFLEHNCYMHPKKENIDLMSRLIERLGLKSTFYLVLFAYVHANFMQEGVSVELWRDLIGRHAPGAEWSEDLIADCMALGEMSEELDPRFRVQTTEMYLKMEGFEGEVFDLLNIPFMQIFMGNKDFQKALDGMASVVVA